jgi:protein O-mannosyl-transferase
MAKKVNKSNPRPAQVVRPNPKPKQHEVVEEKPFVPDPKIPAWLYTFKAQAIIIGVLAFAFYCNTFQNEYALDDTIVIAKNEYVYEGFAGIPSILTKDAFDSYYKQFNSSNQLSGGRYRPLSIMTFAIEQQFFGTIPANKVDSVVAHAGEKGPQETKFIKDMHVRHVFSVLWFTLSVIVLLYFLRYVVFRNNPLMALIAAILFVIHPIHTEVVANVKSRDEIMSLMFICLTFIFAFRYEEQKEKKSLLIWGLVFLFLGFLSKEYAVSLIILMPLSFYLFKNFSFSKSITASLPYFAVMGGYMLIRKMIVADMSPDAVNDILNNPYALASDVEKLATKISTTLNYLKLLVFPHPLSADYSYNTIPYKDFTNIVVWLSLAIHIGIIYGFFHFLKKRSVLAFAIAFYMVNVLLICNIIFNIGGTMGERLIYHSSVGFCIAVAWLLYTGMEKMKPALVGVMVVLICLGAYKTIPRNAQWKNDKVLFFEDIKVAPNSVLVNADVASSYVNMADYEIDTFKKLDDIHTGIKYFSKAIEINPAFVSGYLNRGMAYFKLRRPDSALFNLNKVKELYPRYPKLDEMYFNVGVNFYMNQQYNEAMNVWQGAIKMSPPNTKTHQDIQNAIIVLGNQMAGKK